MARIVIKDISMDYFINPNLMKTATRSSWCVAPSPRTEVGRASTRTITGQHGGAAVFGIGEILVPTDFSEHANVALKYAIRFAEHFGAGLTLLHIVEPLPATPFSNAAFPSAEFLNHLSLSARKRMADLCEENSLKFPIFRQAIVSVGVPDAIIAETARQLKSNLIILATNGRTGLAHMVLGDLAERVIRQAPCPVLIIPRDRTA